MGIIGSILSGVAALLRWGAALFTAENRPDVVAAKEGQQDQDAKAQIEKDIAKKDAGAIGRDIS